MDRDLKIKVDALLTELRSWGPDEAKNTAMELAKAFKLTKFIVVRLANSEGVSLKPDPAPVVDPDSPTVQVSSPVDTQRTTKQDRYRTLGEILDDTDTLPGRKPSKH